MVSNLSVLLTDEKDEATQKLSFVLRNNKMDVRLCAKNGAELLKLYEDFVVFFIIIFSLFLLFV